MKQPLLITLLIFTSCTNHQVTPQLSGATEQVKDDSVVRPNAKSESASAYEISKVDDRNGHIDRVFVVINPSSVYDTSQVRQVILSVKSRYVLDSKSSVSFFSDRRYADYKDNLFDGTSPSLSMSEYKNWLDLYYLGEYSFESNQYITFPACAQTNKQKVYRFDF